jgi:UDP-3-O-[3-hydroxymyristoyl] glucosamine N-acyltransferase
VSDTTHTSDQLAQLVDGELVGPADVPITGVAALALAGATDVSFLGDERYRAEVMPSAAGVVLIPAEGFDEAPPAGRAWIKCADPAAAFAGLVPRFVPPPVEYEPGIHPSAVVHATATVAPTAHIGALVVVEAGASIGENSVIAAGAYVGHGTSIGDGCLIYQNVTLRERTRIGNRVTVHAGTVIGSDGFGYEQTPTGHKKIPQVGFVQIDDDVEIGACTAIDRARFGKTWIKMGAKIDNLVQIAHNVVIGEFSLIIAQVGIAGSTCLGQGVVMAGQAGAAGHLRIGAGSVVAARGGVVKDLPAGSQVAGMPSMDRREYVKRISAHKGVERCRKQIDGLKAEIAELKAMLADRATS